MHADPKRAEELRHIGPPLSCSGWAQLAWPRLTTLVCICSGAFAVALPNVRSCLFSSIVQYPHSHQARMVLGPNITIHNFGYGCTEGLRGKAINFGDSGDFVLETEDIVEFLDVTEKQTVDNIVQAVCILSTLRMYPFPC